MNAHKFGHLLGKKVTGIATTNLSKDGTEVGGISLTFSNKETLSVSEQWFDHGGWGRMMVSLEKKKKK